VDADEVYGMNEELIKKHKISKFYRYAEHRDGDRIEFGWKATNEVALPAVVSSVSKSKSATDKELEHSNREGVNATSLLDYIEYFNSLVGQSPEQFLVEWSGKHSEFPAHWAGLQSNYDEKQAAFIIKLAMLITEDKKFSMFGRLYKVVR
jgi:hypothetical protein